MNTKRLAELDAHPERATRGEIIQAAAFTGAVLAFGVWGAAWTLGVIAAKAW